jgi:hypothetical protein
MMQKSIEHVMIETVAYYDPIDYHRLQRLVGERLNGEYSTARHRTALDNLANLDMIERGGVGHEYVHLTNKGWSHLGGETPRHDEEVESIDAPVCDVCAEDELVESGW